ncbi:xylulokinase [Salinispirillum marinum]|uniref:Xylulose kinase n=2 Tax=Saccharospirillaceae TaxID=255527 RepID=A0ABV8BIS1_9GAMM
MFLGLDLGTSGLKAMLVDSNGHVLGSVTQPLTTTRPHPQWSEQDPHDWWVALVAACQMLAAEHDLNALKAIGLSGHMHGAVLLDQAGDVLRPCILWNDGRSAAQCRTLMHRAPNLHALSGNLAMPGFTAPKLLWVEEHEPEIFAQTATVLLPKDYLRYRLTGDCVSEMSDAAGTLWLNPATRDWDDDLLAATHLTRAQMPTLIEGSALSGTVAPLVAAELGIPSVPVAGGGGDNAAGAVGVGVTEPGQGFISLGTSGVYFVVSDRHNSAPEHTVHAFCHALPRRWHQMGVTLSAASALSWWADVAGQTVEQLLAELEHSEITETPVLFLPYLNGERTPHNDALASAQWFGMTGQTTRAHLTLSILEGVAFSVADCAAALRSAGTEAKELTLIGGGARSARWRQIIADVLQRPLDYRAGGEAGPALGAARLAMLALTGDGEARIRQVCTPPPVVARHEPDPHHVSYYTAKLARYRQLYRLTLPLEARHEHT